MRASRNNKEDRKFSPSFLTVISGLTITIFLLASLSVVINKSVSQKLPQMESENPRVTTQSMTTPSMHVQDDPAVIALKNGDLYSIDANNLLEKRLTTGGGFGTSIFYWFSPDQTKLVSKQDSGLWLVTKENATLILQNIPGRNIESVAWRSDSKALLIVHIVNDDEECKVGRCPGLSELFTYDLENGKSVVVKQFKKQDVGIVFWDKETQLVGYTVGGGEGGAFGTYHVFDLISQDDTTYQTRWINPVVTPDRQEFVVLDTYDEIGEVHHTIEIYSVLNLEKPLYTHPSPGEYFGCLQQTASVGLHPGICLGIGKNFWFKDGRALRSFDTRSGIMSDVALLPPEDDGVSSDDNPSLGAWVLDVTKDQNVILTQQKNSGQLEYTLYDFVTAQSTPLGFSAGGPIQSRGQFWTHQALGFLY